MQVLSAAFFLEFDEDGSGSVDRSEFRNNLWMLTRASKAEKMRY
jgi:Ca2+-binding EF-hand superfamily protein